MEKILYYTEKENAKIQMKTISVYEIIENKPKKFFYIDTLINKPSIESIQSYLDDNGFEDQSFSFQLL